MVNTSPRVAEPGVMSHARMTGTNLSDFDGLDLERRKVIADLLVNYSGW